METTELLWAVVPTIFGAGGVYAVFKWRVKRLEDAVEKMANSCVSNRTNCNNQLSDTLELMRHEFKELFGESLLDRKEMRKEINEIGKVVVRLDQKLLNGHYRAGHGQVSGTD